MIPDQTLDSIREATDAVELISAYVKLRRRGQNYVGLCPFHSEKTPSFSVNRERQIFHCFGCGKGGDVFRFLVEHERMSFPEAVKYLADRAHIELPKSDRADTPDSGLQEAMALALEYFDKAISHESMGQKARAYLSDRKLDSSSVTQFSLGYAPDRLRGLLTYARRSGLSLSHLEAAGLAVPTQEGSHDRFRDRLMFPVRSVSGKPIAFGGRDLSGRSKAKYMNSPETALYEKSKVLYGLYEARSHMQKTGTVLLCEGYFDLIRLHAHGFGHAVAVSGTALSPYQARVLARYVTGAWLLFDADGAGEKAALRSVPVLFEAGLDVRIAGLPKGMDPDLFLLKEGSSALSARLEKAPDFVEFLETQAGAPFSRLSMVAQDRFVAEVVAVASSIQDPVRQDLLIQRAWSRAGIPEAHIRSRLSRQTSAPGAKGVRPEAARDWREELLSLLVASPDLRLRAKDEIKAADFESPLQRQLLGTLLSKEHLRDTHQKLSESRIDKAVLREISRLAALPLSKDSEEQAFGAYLTKIRLLRLRGEAARLVTEIAEAERQGEEERAKSLSRQHLAVRNEWIRLGRAVPDAGE